MASFAPSRSAKSIKADLDAEKAVATGFIRVHSPEAILPRGRVLQNWTVCHKPHTGVTGGGCRNALGGFFVRTNDGVLKRVFWVGKKGSGATGVCNWVEGEEGAEGEEDGDEGEEGEGEGDQELTAA